MNKKILFLIALLMPIWVQSAPLSEPASLREVIPSDAIGYIRIPNPWGLLSSPKDNVLKDALAHEQHVQQIQNIKASVFQNILKKTEAEALTLLLHHLRSPIEAVFLLPEYAPPMLTNLLLSAKLNITTIAELNQVLKTLAAKIPALNMMGDITTEGDGLLIAGPIPIFIHYNLNNQTLHLMAGIIANQTQFQQTLSRLRPVKEHPMYDIENRLDTSHQGYFKWINIQRLLPLFQATIPPKTAIKLQKWGLFNLRALATSWGIRNNKGRISLMIDMPKAGYRQYFPAISNNISLTTAGKPGTVFSLSVPLFEWLKGLEKVAEQEAKPEKLKSYQSFKENFKKELSISIEDALQALGPEMLIFTDEAGEFFAVKIRDEKLMQKILKLIVTKQQLPYNTREINGKTYHHLSTTAFSNPDFLSENQSEPSRGATFWLELLSKLKSHFYWTTDEGYLIFAKLPQQLFDRQQHQARTSIQQWLKNEQRQDNQNSLFLASTSISNTPRYLYYAYLQTLNALADLAETEIDLFKLPTAMELNLPKSGTYGLQLDISETHIGLEFTFENNPLEFLFNTDLSSMAIIGLLSAIAIPAYIDSIKAAEIAREIEKLN